MSSPPPAPDGINFPKKVLRKAVVFIEDGGNDTESTEMPSKNTKISTPHLDSCELSVSSVESGNTSAQPPDSFLSSMSCQRRHVSGISLTPTNQRFGNATNIGFTPTFGGSSSSAIIGAVSPSFAMLSRPEGLADDKVMLMYDTPEKILPVLGEYYSHSYMNFITDDVDGSTLEKMCMMSEVKEDPNNDNSIFGCVCPTLNEIMDQTRQENLKLTELRQIINSVGRPEYSALLKGVSLLLDEEGKARKITKWHPTLKPSVKCILIARDRAWKKMIRKERNPKEEYVVKLLKGIDPRGLDMSATKLWFEYKTSFASFIAVLQDCSNLQHSGGYTLQHGPWKYQVGRDFNFKGNEGDWKELKDEETYRIMVHELQEQQSDHRKKIGIIHSVELAIVLKESTQWAEWEEEQEEFKKTQMLDENGNPFFDPGNYLEFLRNNPEATYSNE